MKLSPEVRHWFDFLLAMTEKEIKARYKHAALGFLWIFINPLLQMAVIGFVFRFFIPIEVDNYFLFLFAGLLPWNFFSISLSKTTPSIVYERSLVQKARFPKEAIVLSIILSNLFHFLVSVGLLLVVLISSKLLIDHYTFFQLSLYILRFLWLVPLTLWLTIMIGGLSLLLSALNVKYRDVNFIVQAILPLWFYATPIIYTLNLLPTQLHSLFYLNPLTAIVTGFQWTMLQETAIHYSEIAVSFCLTMIITAIGWQVFKKESKFFDDWI